MGDFRAVCKIELCDQYMEFYLNWEPYEINQTVLDWMEEVWKNKCDVTYMKFEEAANREKEDEEKAEYLRLKQKYEKK